MRLQCPKCEHQALDERRAGAGSCPACGGMWVPLYEVPRLLEDGVATSGDAPAATDAATGMCPARHGIMSRARVETATPFTLERCSSCFGVWFDRGEWQRLADAHLVDDLPHFWSREWQAQQRRVHSRNAHLESAKEDFGGELYAQLVQLAETLRGDKRRSEALAFLREESDPHGER
jgi:Zn-finger nucleic acid-binding protein